MVENPAACAASAKPPIPENKSRWVIDGHLTMRCCECAGASQASSDGCWSRIAELFVRSRAGRAVPCGHLRLTPFHMLPLLSFRVIRNQRQLRVDCNHHRIELRRRPQADLRVVSHVSARQRPQSFEFQFCHCVISFCPSEPGKPFRVVHGFFADEAAVIIFRCRALAVPAKDFSTVQSEFHGHKAGGEIA